MAAPWTTYPGLSAPECVTCCTTRPPICGGCVFDIAGLATGGSSAFADYATAVQYLDGTLATADCWGWLWGAPSSAVFSSDTSADDVLVLSASFTNVIGPGQFNSCVQYASIDVADTAVLTVDWVLASWSGANSRIEIFDCTGLLVDSFELDGASGTHVFPALGGQQYVIACIAEGADEDPNFNAVFTISSSLAMVALPVIATYIDSPDTWDAEACPKLLIPLLAETGSFYANKSDANDVLLSAQVSNCVGFYANSNINSGGSFTATDGVTTLLLQLAISQFVIGVMVGSVNAIKGETISVDYLVTATSTGVAADRIVFIQIRDQRGAVIDTFVFSNYTLPHSGTFTSIALPRTGKYIVWYVGASSTGSTGPSPPTASECTIRSSGVMSVNPVSALYDRSIDCAAHIECELAP